MKNLELNNVTINDADETFWGIDGLVLNNVTLHEGTYPFMHCNNIKVNGLNSDSKYVFQYSKNIEVHDAHIVTKDSFWEVENVTVYDSYLDGEYLGWHSKNLRLVNCHIAGEVFLIAGSEPLGSAGVQADIKGHIKSIKNPSSGKIVADSIGEIIIDKNIKAPADCQILTRG